MRNGNPSLTSISQILQSSFKAMYRDQEAIGSSGLVTSQIQNWTKKGQNLYTVFQL